MKTVGLIYYVHFHWLPQNEYKCTLYNCTTRTFQRITLSFYDLGSRLPSNSTNNSNDLQLSFETKKREFVHNKLEYNNMCIISRYVYIRIIDKFIKLNESTVGMVIITSYGEFRCAIWYDVWKSDDTTHWRQSNYVTMVVLDHAWQECF